VCYQKEYTKNILLVIGVLTPIGRVALLGHTKARSAFG
jgi:hypothetical protein